ncbi:MAG: hypothetical protein C4288_13590 [Leptolyngbya sp. ERB_1_1]
MQNWEFFQQSMSVSADRVRGNAKADLLIFKPISLREPAFLLIEVQDLQGKAIEQFDQVRDRQMHLIVVSDDLSTFETLYPTYQGKGRFTVEATFSEPGSYTLFSCCQPSGQPEIASALKLTVPGISPPAPEINLSETRFVNNTEVYLRLPQFIPEYGEEMTIAFDLQDRAIDPLKNLKPYRRAPGNLVIVHRSFDLTGVSYIPTQPILNVTEHQLEFTTRLPQPGLYKLWLQFEHNQELLMADFWLKLYPLEYYYE